MTGNILFIGCGKVATGAASILHRRGYNVTGVRRKPANLPNYLQSVGADVTDAASLDFLSPAPADTVVYSLAAGAFDAASYTAAYVTGLRNVIDFINFNRVKRLIFVSSTSVYHQDDNSVVDENSAVMPTGFSGQIMLQAEELAHSTGIATCLRFSGIYGPNRYRLIERVRKGECTVESTRTYSNRIHSKDCSGVIAHLVEQQALPAIILATDSLPVLSTEVETFIAAQLGVEKRYTTTGTSKRIAGSKRCSNQRLLDTGYDFTYPDYKSGYSKLITDYLDTRSKM